ncbi:MAG: carboxyltransferase domain-containing protein, partial [Rhodocyclaceae bacterium]|nr:carboxyltransferase domain-containing protein [Rhodocyclaceae bacterium]
MTPRMLDCGDTAFTVEFGNLISPALLAAVNALDAAILRHRDDPALAGIVETVPTFRSLTVIYDPLATSREILESALARLLEESGDAAAPEGRQ